MLSSHILPPGPLISTFYCYAFRYFNVMILGPQQSPYEGELPLPFEGHENV